MIRYKQLTSVIGLLLYLTYATLAHADDNLAETLRTLVTTNKHPYLQHSDLSDQQQAIQTLYQLNQYRPVWLNNDRDDGRQIEEILGLLAAAKDHGLNPQDYDSAHLAWQWGQIKSRSDTPPQMRALYDSALNVALLRYLSDLHVGRIKTPNIELNPDIITDKLNLPELILSAAAENNPTGLIAKVEPMITVYGHLKQALSHYRKLAQEHSFPAFTFSKVLRPGQKDPQIPQLRQLLTALGDMEQSDTTEPTVFDSTVVDAMKNFQRRHGLEADGIVGQQTVAALNVPLSHRVTQIELAMERLRWLPIPNQGQLIIVNIPAFQLWAYDGVATEEIQPLNMKVIVGESLDKQTPAFMANMQFLQFKPYWNVPTSIAQKELLPKLRRNPGYLAKERMELVNHFGPDAVRYPVNNNTLALLSQSRLKIRQTPGKWNALGSVKFVFPNRFNVYLHDTSTPQLFKRSRRDFSHGCIRVEKPEALAEFVLKSKEDWDQEKISAAMRSGNTRRVQLNTPIPVLIYYSTAMATSDSVLFFDDIYRQDETLIQALSKPLQQLPASLPSAAVISN